MRNALCQSLLRNAERDEQFVFLTGDLGYAALEPLQEALGPRFINAGIAEQNMVSVAAGLASGGLHPWVYSIGPFIYARPFEQIRNDVCLHNLPVRLIGNGGGYAYGVMGATHHSIEDYGALCGLQGMRVYAPTFSQDVEAVIDYLRDPAVSNHPAYLRLGRDESPAEYVPPAYAPWRRLLPGGDGPVIVAVGPLAGGLVCDAGQLPLSKRPRLWALTELPVRSESLPPAFLDDLEAAGGRLLVAEEHVAHGGAGQMIAHALLQRGRSPRHFAHHFAVGYVSGRYGSQTFHRRESGLDSESLFEAAARLGSVSSVSGPEAEFIP